MANIIGKSTVLPDRPYSPNMPVFPQVSLTRDTLAAHNAMGQSLSQATPRPAPTIVNTPKFNVPQGPGLSLNEMLMGGGYGQGVVANSPRPAANFVPSTPSLDVSALAASRAADFTLDAYKMMGQRLTPEGQYLRPSHMNEIYGDFDHTPDVSHLNRMRPETMMPSFDAHQPTANLGGSPAFEVDRNAIRPTNPRLLSRGAPQVNIQQAEQRIPIRERPIIPASTQPRINNSWAKNLTPAKKIRMEAEYRAPPVRNSDMGGLGGLSTSFGSSGGRSFGADSHLRSAF
jgi:hypothetical protein